MSQYMDDAIAPGGADGTNLARKELVVIGWTCQLAEAMAWLLKNEPPADDTPPPGQVLQWMQELNDRAEHIAQSALEGVGSQVRAEFLQNDVAAMLGLIERNKDWLHSSRMALPPADVMRAWVL